MTPIVDTEVGESGISVGIVAVICRLHARDVARSIERSKKIFFIVMLSIVDFPFVFNHSHQEC